MPAARYWRIVGIETYAGGGLELSELHLYGESGRLDATATLTSTIAPTSGTLAALQDDNLGTTCRFAGAAVRAGGFALVWDFGVGNTADALGVRLGAAAQDVFLAGCSLQYSTDGAQWVLFADFARYAWPGAGAYTVAPAVGDPHFDKVSLLLHMDGADGSKVFTDSSLAPKAQTVPASGVALSTAQSKFGGASALFNGGYIWFGAAGDAALAPGTQDFCIEAWCYDTGGGNRRVLAGNASSSGPGGTISIMLTTGNTFSIGVTADGTRRTIEPSTPTPLHQWYHLALVRSGTTVKLFLNGTEIGATTGVTGSVPAGAGRFALGSSGEYLGYGGSYGVQWMGFVDDFRYTIGVARYTANFTPPTAAFTNIAAGTGGTVFVAPTQHTANSAAQIAVSAPVPAFSTRTAPALTMARDVEVGGPGTIYGTTKTKGTPNVPTKARVVLLHQRSKLPVRETWSDPVTGAFAFTGIDTTQQFLTLAEDAAGNYRPVAANRLTPEEVTP